MSEHVYIKVNLKKISLILGKYSNLAPKYCRPFEILAKVGLIAYQLALPNTIKVHNFFRISILNISIHDDTHVIDWNVIQFEPEGEFQVGPKCILDRRELLLWNCTIGQVKMQWKYLSLEEATWELESNMWEAYLVLFQDDEKEE